MKTVLSLVLAVSAMACAARAVVTETPAQKAAADPARGVRLAAASKPTVMPRLVPGSSKMQFPVDAARAGVQGAAIVAFVVQPNGRVDRESRTLIYYDGHQIYAKHVCDFLLAARFEPAAADERGLLLVLPGRFTVPGGTPRDSGEVAFRETQRRLQVRLATMSELESRVWFAARPSCSAIKIGLNPLYGGPPE